MLVSSTYDEGPVQPDQRRYIYETHVNDDGREFKYEWLWDGALDPRMVTEERAAVINATLAAREAAHAFVVGTDVPYTKHEFLSFFTEAERITIRQAARVNEQVLDYVEMLNASGGVYMSLARPKLAGLAAAGLITAERAAEIGAH